MRKLVRAENRQQARRMVTRAIINGVLIRPEECSNCGRSKPDAKKAWIEAHHHKGYLHPYTLDVIWLCPSCHKLAHPESMASRDARRHQQIGRERSPESIAKQKETIRIHAGESRGWTPERREAARQNALTQWSDGTRSREEQSERAKRSKPWLGK